MTGGHEDAGRIAATLIHSRRTVLPKRLVEPGPDAAQLQAIIESAAAAPDHGEQVPWRFVLVPQAQRARLGEAFARALLERDALATAAQQEEAREKALRSPVLLLAIVRSTGGDAAIPPDERVLSAGCAIQNMLLMATALGFGSSLTSGKAMSSRALRALFALEEGERAVCFINIGTAGSARKPRERPSTQRYFSELPPA